MGKFLQIKDQYERMDYRDLSSRQLDDLLDGLKNVSPEEISSSEDGRVYIELLRKLRESVAENDKRHGKNYPEFLNSLLSVGEDGLYSNNLRFIYELIQNADDCDYNTPDDCKLDMRFDFNNDEIVLTYNEVGFTPFNVFAITGIAEAAKNVSSSKNEIGEKGIGFKSVFGVAHKEMIRSGWFSFEPHKDNFTVPVPAYHSAEFYPGTKMILYVPGCAQKIYVDIKNQYCREDALFSRNPLLFLNKLTSLKMYSDKRRSMEFCVSRSEIPDHEGPQVERNVVISVNLHDHDYGSNREFNETKQIRCSRYSLPVVFSREACQARYGVDTEAGKPNGKPMILRAIVPNLKEISKVKNGSLYSFLPTQLKLTVPMVCHVPFKLDASREFVDPQGENLWFQEASNYLAKLINAVYMNLRTAVKEDIVRYLPGASESLFAPNNGKERCLSQQKSFSGSHYLELPLFYTIDKAFHKAKEIFCFAEEEQIVDQEKVFKMMGYQSKLFIPSGSVKKFGFETKRSVKDLLFMRSLSIPSVTSEILDYLDSVEYEYDDKLISSRSEQTLSANQIETLLNHNKLYDRIKYIAFKNKQRAIQPLFSIMNLNEQNLPDVLYKGFELSETPQQVAEYTKKCQGKCICLDIAEDSFLPCQNALVLSQKNALSSFVAFCRAIDPRDIFSIRIGLREASNKLDHYVKEETVSASEFLRNLSNIRRIIKDSLGDKGYRSYINLILRSGTDKSRYIQELLQNADDCDYPPDVVPSFSLTQRGNSVFTNYNEVGFNRANIRSITAIGESTKNKLIEGQAIGEKGVGFKTIFAIAAQVKIYSGEYAFSLSDFEPTIPKPFSDEHGYFSGTSMEIVLKEQHSFPAYDDRAILEKCLCLRKLRSIKIGNHIVSIEDNDDRRIITINKRQYIFKRFVHHFTVENSVALQERSNESRIVSPEQTITCFVPERGGLSEYALYNGLPTKHRIRIPLVIDAPFMLTTSREEIVTEGSLWNSTVRKELYTAVMNVIDVLKGEEREDVFRFTNFNPHRAGSVTSYHNEISDCEYINLFDYLNALRGRMILPTFDDNIFAIPQRKASYRFPEAANILFRSVPKTDFAGIRPASIIVGKSTERNNFEKALNALECENASFGQVFPIIEKHAERFIRQEDFRVKLYEFLQESPAEYRERIKQLPIIPVYEDIADHVRYIHWVDDRIFVKKNAITSGPDYYVLNEKLLPKGVCEKIFGTNINEMNAEWERNRYNERLRKTIRTYDTEQLYRFLLTEFRSGAFQKYDSFAILNADSGMLPLKNELGDIVTTTLFVCNQPSGYFATRMIRQMTVHKECEGFAKYIRFETLSGIHYDDIDFHNALTADDVEALKDDYFLNSEEILRGFYKDGLLSDLLLEQYKLGYLAFGREDDSSESYEFPNDPVGNIFTLRNHVQKQSLTEKSCGISGF